MNVVSPKHDGDVFDKGKSPENKGKNRYSNIIPGK
jgi:protein tyrosine phosphatase